MPRLGCDIRIEKPSVDIADRVFDLRNRVRWLKNIEYCLLGDQTDRLTKIQTERHDIEIFNENLRRKLKGPPEKMIDNPSRKNLSIVEDRECIDYKRNRVMQERNQLIFIQRCLLDRLESRRNQTNKKLISGSVQAVRDNQTIARRIREIQDRLGSVKLINKTLKTCKQHLQCDLDLLRKELPNIQKDIGEKFHQKIILKKEFTNIVAENKRHLKAYQQLVNQTEIQNRQRRAIHEQAMTSVAEQLEDQYQVQMMAVNEMTTPFESRKLNGGTSSTTNLEQKRLTSMNSDEITQVRCMYDQFYNIITAGFPIDIDHSEQAKTMTNEISAMLIMTNRMIEEKEQINQQINRTDKLLKLIEMSMNRKTDTRQKIVDTMIEQRYNLELFYMNDTVEEQNRIIRQINDFMIVLSKNLCEYVDIQSLTETTIDFIPRLQYLSDLVLKTIETNPTDEDDRQISSPLLRRSGTEENSQILKESRSIDQSINSSLSSLSSRMKRNPMKTNLY